MTMKQQAKGHALWALTYSQLSPMAIEHGGEQLDVKFSPSNLSYGFGLYQASILWISICTVFGFSYVFVSYRPTTETF